MKNMFRNFIVHEEGAGAVEYAMLIGILGYGMFEAWSAIKVTLVLSYGNILRFVRKKQYP